jgi:uncharacterized membrane protein YedE/YeeE
MWLLVVAAVGMILPNGIFLYWLFHDFTSLSAILGDRLAVAFMIDCFASAFLLTYLFARKPIGPYRWPWFLGLCLLGTLCFGIPMYLWLNWRHGANQGAGFAEWWRSA